MDESNRSIAKRQIARLLGSSFNPICVLSEEDTLVFANEAMGSLVGRSVESLLGLRCGTPVPDDGSLDAHLSAFFALPIHWSRRELKILPEANPFPAFENKKPSADTKPSAESATASSGWIRCLIPLEDGNGCILCIFCQNLSNALHGIVDEQAAIIQKILRDNRNKYQHLDDMWFLQGKSAGARRVLEQVQLAIANPLSLTIFGQSGSGRSWLAQSIQSHRRGIGINKSRFASDESMVRIDCSLMDVELLQSMLEVIVERTTHERASPNVLLDNVEGLPDACTFILASFLRRHEGAVCIATCDAEVIHSLPKGNVLWSEVMMRTGILRIDLPKLVDRMEDLPTLISAWFLVEHKKGAATVEIGDGFLDALMAYSWPGDIEEFAGALTHAARNAQSGKLTDKDLPVNIRTFVSHIEQTKLDESVDLDSILEDVERTLILRALERYPNNKTSAAKLINISRARLLRRLHQWGSQSESGLAEGDDDSPVFNEVK